MKYIDNYSSGSTVPIIFGPHTACSWSLLSDLEDVGWEGEKKRATLDLPDNNYNSLKKADIYLQIIFLLSSVRLVCLTVYSLLFDLCEDIFLLVD